MIIICEDSPITVGYLDMNDNIHTSHLIQHVTNFNFFMLIIVGHKASLLLWWSVSHSAGVKVVSGTSVRKCVWSVLWDEILKWYTLAYYLAAPLYLWLNILSTFFSSMTKTRRRDGNDVIKHSLIKMQYCWRVCDVFVTWYDVIVTKISLYLHWLKNGHNIIDYRLLCF